MRTITQANSLKYLLETLRIAFISGLCVGILVGVVRRYLREEMLTLHRLKVPTLLRKTLHSTNPIESMFSTVRDCEGSLKRYRGSRMSQRWLGAVLLHCEQGLMRVKGYAAIKQVIAAIKAEQAEGRKLNLTTSVFITIDTLRADHLSPYGYNRNTSQPLKESPAKVSSSPILLPKGDSRGPHSHQ